MTDIEKIANVSLQQRADLMAEIERLRTFAHWVINEGPFNGSSLDGGDVQDKAVELGILSETKYDPAIHGESDSAEPGDQWFVFSPPLNE